MIGYESGHGFLVEGGDGKRREKKMKEKERHRQKNKRATVLRSIHNVSNL